MNYYPEDKYLTSWAVYYYNPNTKSYDKYTSQETSWEELPSDGVQVAIRQYEVNGQKRLERMNGRDLYVENWAAEEAIKAGKDVRHLVKFGSMVPDEFFHPMFDAILEDIKNGHN